VTRRSGLLVPAPEAEPLVGALRARWDPTCAQGVPAHVTVLYPFVPAARLDPAVEARVAEAVATVPSFRYALTDVGRFDGVLWLRPEPADGFRALTAALAAAFPQHPPYEGRHAEVVPHLTVADADDAPFAELEAQLRSVLPIEAEARIVRLMVEGPDGRWSTRTDFPLGGA
jgi:2'-5' RNA ligase